MKITVQPYDPAWSIQYESEAALLRKRLPASCLIEHIGSTSVPDLSAKPIIDILIGLPGEPDSGQYVDQVMEDADMIYVPFWESVMPYRRFFIKMKTGWGVARSSPRVISEDSILLLPVRERKCHIHMVHAGHSFFERHLRFRDILREDPTIRGRYAELKQRLAAREWESSSDYAGAKSEFIEQVLLD